MTLESLITMIATNGIGAVCAGAMLWFMYFQQTKTIPAMLETFKQEMKEERAISEKRHTENLNRLEQIIQDTRFLRNLARRGRSEEDDGA